MESTQTKHKNPEFFPYKYIEIKNINDISNKSLKKLNNLQLPWLYEMTYKERVTKERLITNIIAN